MSLLVPVPLVCLFGPDLCLYAESKANSLDGLMDLVLRGRKLVLAVGPSGRRAGTIGAALARNL